MAWNPAIEAETTPSGYLDARRWRSEHLVQVPSRLLQLTKLKNVDRFANAKAIEIARGHGDLSENADYSAAKEEQ